MIVDADHGLQIGRINAAHDIVIARQLWIISIHHTPIIALRQKSISMQRDKSVRCCKSEGTNVQEFTSQKRTRGPTLLQIPTEDFHTDAR